MNVQPASDMKATVQRAFDQPPKGEGLRKEASDNINRAVSESTCFRPEAKNGTTDADVMVTSAAGVNGAKKERFQTPFRK